MTLVPHVVVEEPSLKPGTTLVLTPYNFVLTVSCMQVISLPGKLLVAELTDDDTFWT